MTGKLTKQQIDAQQASTKDLYLWDSSPRGFGLRVRPSGTKTFFYSYRAGGGRSGRKTRYTIGQFGTITLEQARKEAQQLAGRVAAGGSPADDRAARRSEAAREKQTLAAVADDFIERYAKWMKTTNIERQGHFWVRLTWDDWCHKLMFSRSTLKRVLALLKNKDLNLITCQTFKKNGVRVMHVRTSDECPKRLARSIVEYATYKAENRPMAKGSNTALSKGPKTALSSYLDSQERDTQLEAHKIAPAIAVAVLPSPEASSKVFEEASKQVQKDNVVSILSKAEAVPPEIDHQGESSVTAATESAIIHDDYKQTGKKKAKTKPKKPTLSDTLIAIWVDEHKMLGLPVSPFGYGDKLNLLPLLETLPLGAGPDFMRTAVRNWAEVVQVAEDTYGAFNSPDAPVFSYAFRHAAAVQIVMARWAEMGDVQSVARDDQGPTP